MNPIEFFGYLQYVLSFKRFSIILIRKRIFSFQRHLNILLKKSTTSYKRKACFTSNRYFLGETLSSDKTSQTLHI